MAKERAEKKDKDRKHKTKHSDENGVTKSSKKDKKHKHKAEDIEALVDGGVVFNSSTVATGDVDAAAVAAADDGDISMLGAPLPGELVPFANPLADEKVTKKVLRGVKKAAKHKQLKRGVKEVVKCLRKSATSTSSSSSGSPPIAVVILAADISPFDVISHIPVLCEDHSVPYVYVRSRAALGAAGSTKRPTSVVMLVPGSAKGKTNGAAKGDGDEESWDEIYADIAKVVEKAGRNVRI